MASELIDQMSNAKIGCVLPAQSNIAAAFLMSSSNGQSEADWKANLKAPVKDARPQTEVSLRYVRAMADADVD